MAGLVGTLCIGLLWIVLIPLVLKSIVVGTANALTPLTIALALMPGLQPSVCCNRAV